MCALHTTPAWTHPLKSHPSTDTDQWSVTKATRASCPLATECRKKPPIDSNGFYCDCIVPFVAVVCLINWSQTAQTVSKISPEQRSIVYPRATKVVLFFCLQGSEVTEQVLHTVSKSSSLEEITLENAGLKSWVKSSVNSAAAAVVVVVVVVV